MQPFVLEPPHVGWNTSECDVGVMPPQLLTENPDGRLFALTGSAYGVRRTQNRCHLRQSNLGEKNYRLLCASRPPRSVRYISPLLLRLSPRPSVFPYMASCSPGIAFHISQLSLSPFVDILRRHVARLVDRYPDESVIQSAAYYIYYVVLASQLMCLHETCPRATTTPCRSVILTAFGLPPSLSVLSPQRFQLHFKNNTFPAFESTLAISRAVFSLTGMQVIRKEIT